MPLLLLFLLLQPLHHCVSASAVTVTVTAAPSIPSREPSYSKRHVFTSAVLGTTNAYRREHNASELAWNATLASFAASYLDGRAQQAGCAFEHSGGPYGENIAIGYGNATAAVEAWGDERRVYDFADPGFDHATGHFTQLVWKATTTVGCERVLCAGDRGWFVACEYWPRGNIQGRYGDEVQRQMSSGAERAAAGAAGWRAVVLTAVSMVLWLSWA
ncbi:SCP-like extracellular protein [Cordyceps javanica]|uniref:SCP-like extracellular protein n=1 Tax=Cordyceps javanica TaxID=43265 RepID=A0A545UR50_9HYPO|nr:SCP-like extracellular protein [Cordyceps javanica]TQW03889.1 SCP-like extracellular protein [Cordyceps javanica]